MSTTLAKATASQPTFRLMELPRDIQFMIVELSLDFDVRKEVDLLNPDIFYIDKSLLLTCRLIYAIASRLLRCAIRNSLQHGHFVARARVLKLTEANKKNEVNLDHLHEGVLRRIGHITVWRKAVLRFNSSSNVVVLGSRMEYNSRDGTWHCQMGRLRSLKEETFTRIFTQPEVIKFVVQQPLGLETQDPALRKHEAGKPLWPMKAQIDRVLHRNLGTLELI